MNYIGRWKTSAKHNLFIHRAAPLSLERFLLALVHPREYRNRVNMWILCAGMLDTARYMNLTQWDADLHDEYDGNWRERAIYSELGYYITFHHERSMQNFRVSFKADTDNFANALVIKQILHENIMTMPNYDRVSAVSLLTEATLKSLQMKTGAVTA